MTQNERELLSCEQRVARASLVTWTGSLLNIILAAFKLFAGIAANSSAMIADGVHTLSDFATDLVIIFSFRVVRKPADSDHDYGHGKFETLAALIVGTLLFLVALGILYSGLLKIYLLIFQRVELGVPGLLAFFAALISIGLKEFLYQLTVKVARKIDSPALLANAWHHRSDAFSSIGTALGIGGAIFLGSSFRLLDPLAAVIVALFIVRVSLQIAGRVIKELLEGSLDEKTKEEIVSIASKVDGIIEPHDLKTRKIGSKIVIDLHVRVANQTSVYTAHKIIDKLEEELRSRFGSETLITIHTEPEQE